MYMRIPWECRDENERLVFLQTVDRWPPHLDALPTRNMRSRQSVALCGIDLNNDFLSVLGVI